MYTIPKSSAEPYVQGLDKIMKTHSIIIARFWDILCFDSLFGLFDVLPKLLFLIGYHQKNVITIHENDRLIGILKTSNGGCTYGTDKRKESSQGVWRVKQYTVENNDSLWEKWEKPHFQNKNSMKVKTFRHLREFSETITWLELPKLL